MTARTITTAADLAALGNASAVPEAAVEALDALVEIAKVGVVGSVRQMVDDLAKDVRAALTAAPSATRDEVARSIPVDALATFITGHGGDFETGQWRVELAFPLSEPVSVDSWRQDLIDAITPKEDR